MTLTRRPFFLSAFGALAICLLMCAGRSDAGAPRVFVTVLLDGGQPAAAHGLARGDDRIVAGPARVGRFTMARMAVTAERASELRHEPGVYKVLPWTPPRLHDERSGQILAGAVDTMGALLGPGYLEWLDDKGLAGPLPLVVDITDDGFDRGSVADVPPEFLDASGSSRVSYARDFTSDLASHDLTGHGTLNASIIAAAKADAADSSGFDYTLGIAPGARIGSSRIFNDDGDFELFAFYSAVTAPAWRDGARVTSNSWGSAANIYTPDAIEYDEIVRDADPATPGHQPLIVVFSAGNAGPGGKIESPGTAKNIITVGASEGVRSGTDGCQLGPASADSALDMASFSAGGPVDDGRIKPDLVAPGTHITGTRSRADGFTGNGVCGEFPGDRTRFTWSSGTSHAAPAVAGAAALLHTHLETTLGAAPSPALIKAWLANTTRYMTGAGANDDLPSPRQGWGLLDLARALDDAPRVVIDQTERFDTEGAVREYVCVPSDPALPVRVTLCWTDAPGDPSAMPLANDLDLEVDTNGATYPGNHFSRDQSIPEGPPDPRNTIEGVWLASGGGPLRVRVRATVLEDDGVPGVGGPRDQDFALVVYNATLQAAPILTVSAAAFDTPPEAGATSAMTLMITNSGTSPSAAGALTVTTATAGVTVLDPNVDVPALPVGGSAALAPVRIALGAGFPCTAPLGLAARTGDLTIPVQARSGASTGQVLFEDDVENGELWTVESTNSGSRWFISTERALSGSNSWHAVGINLPGIGSLVSPPIQIPVDAIQATFSFSHLYELERGFDGGVVEISDGGPFVDLGPYIRQGAYPGAVSGQLGSPFGTRNAWSGLARNFSLVTVDLTPFAGRTVRLRLRIGTDFGTGTIGWYVDDLRVSALRASCVTAGGSLPAITQITYKNGKLKLKGTGLSAQSTIEINGRPVSSPVVFRADKGFLRVKATSEDLNLRATEANTIVIRSGGYASRPFGFVVR